MAQTQEVEQKSSAYDRWTAASRAGAPQVVGSFYQSIAQRITGAEPTTDRMDGDLIAWVGADAIGIEVKSGNSNQPIRIDWDQFEHHWDRAKQFPYDGFSYLVFSYTAHESMRDAPGGLRHKRRLMLYASVVEGRGEEFLAQRTRHLWVLPLPIIRQLHRRLGVVKGAFPSDKHDPALKFGRRFLRTFTAEVDDRRNGWRVRHGTAELPQRNGLVFSPFSVTVFESDKVPVLPLKHVQWK